MPCLRIIAGPDAGTVVELDGARVTVGRDAGNALRVNDVKSSRVHAEIACVDGQYRLTDLESSNGTWQGDDRITSADWSQAGRYAAGLDPRNPVCTGGSPSPNLMASGPLIVPTDTWLASPEATCTLVVSNAIIGHHQTNCLYVTLKASGNENTVGFSISFEPELLRYVSAIGGSGLPVGASVLINSNDVAQGRLGFLIGLRSGLTFEPGDSVIAQICFQALPFDAPGGDMEDTSASITMIDDPIVREIVDLDALPVPVDYQNATVLITSKIAFSPISVVGGGDVTLNLVGPPGRVVQIQASSDLTTWDTLATVTNVTGTLQYLDSVPAETIQRFYRATMP